MYAIRRLLALIVVALTLVCITAPPAPAAAIREIFGIGSPGTPPGGGSTHIFRIDLDAGTVTNLGAHGVPIINGLGITNLAMAPDRTLYFMNPFEVGGGGHDLYKATLNGTNTALVGITKIKHLPTTGFGIIDGFTVGPDGKLYMTGYGKSEIYRYDVVADTFVTAVKLVGGGEFRSDLAFDPLTGNLVGQGIEPGSSDRTLFEIPAALATTGSNNPYVWTYFGGPASPWATVVLNSGAHIGGNPDGIAFDPTTGGLFLSGDGTGIYAYNRATAVKGALVPGTGNGSLSGIGWDLAFQTLETPISEVPEPTSIALFGIMAVGGMAYGWRRRNQATV